MLPVSAGWSFFIGLCLEEAWPDQEGPDRAAAFRGVLPEEGRAPGRNGLARGLGHTGMAGPFAGVHPTLKGGGP